MEFTLDDVRREIGLGSRVVLLVRHAERPKMDPDDPTFGDDLPITYEGERTARKLGRLLAEFRDDAQFYSSPLRRTRMTAACIAEGMGLDHAEIPTDGLLGNESFYYRDALQVLDVFKVDNFFPACVEYFATGEQRGFNNLYAATDGWERWIDEKREKRLFVIATHDLYIAAFLSARQAGPFERSNWVRFLDAGAIFIRPDGRRVYGLVRTNLSTGIVGVYPPKTAGVVFDFGGVMTTSTMPERVRACCSEFGIDWHSLERGFARYRRLMDGGFLTLEQMYDLVWADADMRLTAEQRERIFKEDTASFLSAYRNERTRDWMRELKAQGYKIGILTNMPPSFAVRFRECFADFIEVADAIVISGDEGMFKPQRRIYELLQKRIGLPAEELCFIDDVESNCDGARSAGWHAIRFASNGQVEADFKKVITQAR